MTSMQKICQGFLNSTPKIAAPLLTFSGLATTTKIPLALSILSGQVTHCSAQISPIFFLLCSLGSFGLKQIVQDTRYWPAYTVFNME